MKHLAPAILLVLSAASTNAQWTPIGPPGGGFNAVRFAGERLYAAGNGGVFASSDRGAAWRPLLDVAGWYATMLAADARTPNSIVAVLSRRPWHLESPFIASRLFRSSDAGATWREVTQGLPTEMWIRSLAVDPFHPSTLYLGLGCREASFKTGCDSCSAAATPPGAGIYKSIDGGESWTFASGAFTGNQLCIRGIAPDPANDGIVRAYSETYQFALSRARWISMNGGQTWNALSDDNAPSRDVVVHPRSGRRFGITDNDRSAALVVSDDGATWRRTTLQQPAAHINAFAVDPNDDAILYAATNAGLFRTANQGATWSVTTSAEHGMAMDVALDPSDSRRIFFAAAGGLFVSSDSGATWSGIDPVQVATSPQELAFDPAHPGWLYTVTADDGAAQEVFRSRDGGATWEALTAGATGRYGFAPSLAIAADGTPFSILRPINGTAVMRFDGTRWVDVAAPPGTPQAIVADPVDAATLYVATYPKAIYKTTDGGATWRWVRNGDFGASGIQLLADATGIYAFDAAVLRSVDHGETWQPLGAFVQQTFSLAVAGSTLYRLGVYGADGFQRSDDGGATWTPLPYPPGEGRQLAADRQHPNVVYLRILTDGILRSVDAGRSWSAFNGNLPTLLLNAIAVDPRTHDLFAMTLREGVFKRALAETRRRSALH